jgi:hypothetical protein
MSVNREFSKYRQVVLFNRADGPIPRTMLKFAKKFAELEPDLEGSTRKLKYYRCRRCAFPLAPKSAEVTFTMVHDTSESSDCTHVFLSNPMDWMESQITANESFGYLYCPRCIEHEDGMNKVGEYSWLGIECQGEECGEIIAPGIAFYRNSDDDPGVELHRRRLSLEELEIDGPSPMYLDNVTREAEPSDSPKENRRNSPPPASAPGQNKSRYDAQPSSV